MSALIGLKHMVEEMQRATGHFGAVEFRLGSEMVKALIKEIQAIEGLANPSQELLDNLGTITVYMNDSHNYGLDADTARDICERIADHLFKP